MERQPARTFEDLVVWQKSHALVLAIYRFSAMFPKNELYGLTLQIRRAAVSTPATSPKASRSGAGPTKRVS